MKNSLILIAIATLVMACAPSPESEIAAIRGELEVLEIDDHCEVSIGNEGGERVYIVDTGMVLREDNFEDCMIGYCFVLGAVGRAIESDAGSMRVGTESLWLDMDMAGVHRCMEVADAGGDSPAEMERHLEFVDR